MQTTHPPLNAVAEQVILDRRHLHAHPELGFQEVETARFVAARLRALGLEVQTGAATDPPPKRRSDAVLGHRGRTTEVPPAVSLLSSAAHALRANLSVWSASPTGMAPWWREFGLYRRLVCAVLRCSSPTCGHRPVAMLAVALRLPPPRCAGDMPDTSPVHCLSNP